MIKILNRWAGGQSSRGDKVVASRTHPLQGTQTVQRSSIQTLKSGGWLNNEIINYVGRGLIQPQRGQRRSNIHVYISYLMDNLLSETGSEDQYCFEKVRSSSDGVEGGLAAMDELYTPINADRNHWNCVRIKMARKTVGLPESKRKQR